MNIKEIIKLVNRLDEDGGNDIPDSLEISSEDQILIDDLNQILCNKRFCHEGWMEHDTYKRNAAYFIIQYLKGKI